MPCHELALTPRQRATVLAKTGGTCHLCGGAIHASWQADHVVPHQHGGTHALANYLPILPRVQPTPLELRAGGATADAAIRPVREA